MGVEENWEMVPLTGAPLNLRREEQWRNFENSVNAVFSYGFVATVFLMSMVLVMAIFERLLRPRSSPSNARERTDVEARMVFDGKSQYPSPKMTIYANGVSVLMSGEEIPTFIARPAPAPCPPDRNLWPPHEQ